MVPGDGIGPEIVAQAVRVLEALDLRFELEEAPVGGAAYAATGHPLPETLEIAKAADAILFGAVGDFDCDNLERILRPEQAILGLRKELTLFANLRPARCLPGLEDISPCGRSRRRAIDLLIVRELNGDVYFGEKGIRTLPDGRRQGYDIMSYARGRSAPHRPRRLPRGAAARRKLCSVDKANVLETSQLWRDVVIEVGAEYPDVELSAHVCRQCRDAAGAQPGQFDVIVTGNLFGDILSDQASMCVGSIGLLASASLGDGPQGPVRADPRLGARHRRQGHRQSDGADPVGRDDAAPFLRPSRSREPHPTPRCARCWRKACARPTSGPLAPSKSARARWATPSSRRSPTAAPPGLRRRAERLRFVSPLLAANGPGEQRIPATRSLKGRTK